MVMLYNHFTDHCLFIIAVFLPLYVTYIYIHPGFQYHVNLIYLQIQFWLKICFDCFFDVEWCTVVKVWTWYIVHTIHIACHPWPKFLKRFEHDHINLVWYQNHHIFLGGWGGGQQPNQSSSTQSSVNLQNIVSLRKSCVTYKFLYIFCSWKENKHFPKSLAQSCPYLVKIILFAINSCFISNYDICSVKCICQGHVWLCT